MIVVLLNVYLALLFILVKLRVVPFNLFWKVSPVIVLLLLLVGLFIPMNWGAPQGPALVVRQSIAIVPDVAGDASPQTGYEVSVAGTPAVMGGTSAVAPLWAALIARINAAAGASVGWVNPVLYKHPGALRDITKGSNGTYAAASGWDACTGLGSPDGAKLAAVLARKPSS